MACKYSSPIFAPSSCPYVRFYPALIDSFRHSPTTRATIRLVSVLPLILSWMEWSNWIQSSHFEMAAPALRANYNAPLRALRPLVRSGIYSKHSVTYRRGVTNSPYLKRSPTLPSSSTEGPMSVRSRVLEARAGANLKDWEQSSF